MAHQDYKNRYYSPNDQFSAENAIEDRIELEADINGTRRTAGVRVFCITSKKLFIGTILGFHENSAVVEDASTRELTNVNYRNIYDLEQGGSYRPTSKQDGVSSGGRLITGYILPEAEAPKWPIREEDLKGSMVLKAIADD